MLYIFDRDESSHGAACNELRVTWLLCIYIAINLIAAGRIAQTELIDFQFFKTKKEAR